MSDRMRGWMEGSWEDEWVEGKMGERLVGREME